MLRKCMYQGPVGQWTLFGKTGTGRNHNSNFLEAWFVGYAENKAGESFILHFMAPLPGEMSSVRNSAKLP